MNVRPIDDVLKDIETTEDELDKYLAAHGSSLFNDPVQRIELQGIELRLNSVKREWFDHPERGALVPDASRTVGHRRTKK